MACGQNGILYSKFMKIVINVIRLAKKIPNCLTCHTWRDRFPWQRTCDVNIYPTNGNLHRQWFVHSRIGLFSDGLWLMERKELGLDTNTSPIRNWYNSRDRIDNSWKPWFDISYNHQCHSNLLFISTKCQSFF